MRVLHITTEYPPLVYGGLGTAVGGLVTASAHAGLQVAVLLVGHGEIPAYYESDRRLRPEVAVPAEASNTSVIIWAVPHAIAVSASIEFARRWNPDVIHVHVFWLAHVADAVRSATGAPLVYTVHSLDRAEYELGQGPQECLSQWPIQADLISAADRVIALTEDERELVAQYCPAASGRVHVVGNGIADTQHARMSSWNRRHSEESLTILYTGRFVDRKGIAELLNAAPAILSESPRTRLVMAGGHRHATAHEMADYWLPSTCEPFRDRIIFTGWLSTEELCEWYAKADILVVPSWYEPFGMVVLEGMLYGLAIVATLVGGPKEILSSERTGLFCKARDVTTLATQVIRLIHDPALRLRLGHEAAIAVRSSWLFKHVLRKMVEVYADVARKSISGA